MLEPPSDVNMLSIGKLLAFGSVHHLSAHAQMYNDNPTGGADQGELLPSPFDAFDYVVKKQVGSSQALWLWARLGAPAESAWRISWYNDDVPPMDRDPRNHPSQRGLLERLAKSFDFGEFWHGGDDGRATLCGVA